MPKAKKERRRTVQGLIDLGPLLPRPNILLPSRLFKVMYLNLERQVYDDQSRQQWLQPETAARTVLRIEYCGELCQLVFKRERLRKWFISVEDRQQHLTPGSWGRAWWVVTVAARQHPTDG